MGAILRGGINLIDDAIRVMASMIGKTVGNRPTPAIFDPTNVAPFIRSVKAGDPAAIERMKRLHYGSFYTGAGKRTAFSGIAETELLLRGKGFGGAIFGRPAKGLSTGLGHIKGASFFALGIGTMNAITAPRGHKMSGFAKGIGENIAWATIDLAASTMFGGPVGMAVGLLAASPIGTKVGEAVQMFNDFSRTMRHVNMGGNYEDTQLALTMRQRAALEMGSSVMNARKYLGKEALLMHQ